ncbi:MAG: MarR family transcriptional regulator [Anaerolineales bacterium]|jgi:DNA-binding MarR family transcriptional regulator
MREDLEKAAKQIVEIVPLVMRSLAAEVRKSGHTLSPSHFRILTMLHERSWSLGELAEHEQISSPTVSRSISTLEDRGWAQRRVSSQDRRVVLAEITQQGEAVLKSLQASAEGRVLEMLKPLSPGETRDLAIGLPVLRKVFEQDLNCEIEDS